MYVPPLNALMSVIGSTGNVLNTDSKIQVPARLLRLLLQIAIANSDFNESSYIAQNPDVKEAIKNRLVESAALHYVGYGYFEGRLGGTPDVDEPWYLRTYSDVRLAVTAGKVRSAAEHFQTIGAAEGRSPNANYQAEASEWKKALALELQATKG